MPLTPEANLRRVSSIDGNHSGWVKRTGQAPQPGRWPCRAHGRYHHYHDDAVSIAYLRHHPRSIQSIEIAPGHVAVSVVSGLVSGGVAVAKTELCVENVPDRQDATSLGKAGLLLDAADSLLEDGRDLGRRSLRLGGVCAGDGRDGGCGISLNGPVSIDHGRQGAKTRQLSSKLPMLSKHARVAGIKLN